MAKRKSALFQHADLISASHKSGINSGISHFVDDPDFEPFSSSTIVKVEKTVASGEIEPYTAIGLSKMEPFYRTLNGY